MNKLIHEYSRYAISIITPYRNASPYIHDFFSSIFSQTYPYWTLLIVNHCSTDGGEKLVEEYAQRDSRIQHLHLPATAADISGPYLARNLACSHVTTPLTAFHDIDDIWHPSKLDIQIKYHLSNNLDLSVSCYSRFSRDKYSHSVTHVIKPPRHLDYSSLLFRNPIPMLSVIIVSDLLYSFPCVNHEDYALWLQLFQSRSITYGLCPHLLAFYRVHPSNISGRKVLIPVWVFRLFFWHTRSRLYSLIHSIIWMIARIPIVLQPFFTARFKYSVDELTRLPALHIDQ